jgi:hypothetical protein
MTLSVSTKQLKVLVTGCVKHQLFQQVKFLWWFAWTIWPSSRFRVRNNQQNFQEHVQTNQWQSIFVVSLSKLCRALDRRDSIGN